MGFKQWIRGWIERSPFRPVHMGFYIRDLYFKKYLQQIPVERFKEVLDAGCNDGSYALIVAGKYHHFQVTAVDIDDQGFPGTGLPNVEFKQQDLLKLNELEQYDFIYSIDVLEHIRGNRRVIENLVLALKPGGYLFIHIPYDRDGGRILPNQWFQEFDVRAVRDHIGEQYTPAELMAILQKLGLEVVGWEYTFGFLGKLAWEIDFVCRRHFKIRIILMPLLKGLARLAVAMRHRKGSTLVLGIKKSGKVGETG